MKKIKTFEDACKALKIGTDVPDFSYAPESDRAALAAHYKLIIIAKALNKGWVPNWEDGNEWKYYPYFMVRGGFAFGVCGGTSTFTGVGSRLCFKTSELAEYAGKQFEDLYKEYMVIA